MQSLESIEKVTSIGLEKVVIPETDGSSIILQRNAKDSRKNEISDFGALLPESAKKTEENAERIFNTIFENLGNKDKHSVDILIVAANTSLLTPDGSSSTHKRALETAEAVSKGVYSSMTKFGIPDSQLLNKNGHPVELRSGILTDLKALEDSPKFIDYMVTKYGTGQEFWETFEADIEREKRIEMEAEGPNEIAERVDSYIRVLNNALDFYHTNHPGRRVVAVVIGHYDNLSPYIKRMLNKNMEDYLPIDYGSGIQIEIKADRKRVAHIEGLEISLD